MTTLLTAALRNPFIRTWSTRSTATIAGGRTLTSTDDLIGTLPLIGAKTGHTNDAGWSQVAAVAGRRRSHHRLGARLADRGPAECRSRRAPRLGPRAVPPGQGDRQSPRVRSRRDRVRPCPDQARRRATTPSGRCAWASLSSSGSSLSSALALPVVRGQRVGEVRVFAGGRLIARTPLVAAESVSAVGTAGKARWYARRTVHHLVGLVS